VGSAPIALSGETEAASVIAIDAGRGALARIGIGARAAAVHLVLVALWLWASQTNLPEPMLPGITVALVFEAAPQGEPSETATAPLADAKDVTEAPEEVPPGPAAEAPPLLAAINDAGPSSPTPLAPAAEPIEPAVPPDLKQPSADAPVVEAAPQPALKPPDFPVRVDVIPRAKPPQHTKRAVAPTQRSTSEETAVESAATEPRGTTAPEQTAMAVPVLSTIAPRPVSGLAGNLKPDYPAEARRRRLQGDVVLRVMVSAAGLPDAVSIVAGSGHSLLDDAAVAAIRTWRFSPATRGGAAIAASVDVPVRFRLQD
jgi:protein TonB